MATRSDGVLSGSYYLLDMGKTKYGECIVCRFGELRILIDGGHRSDLKGQPGFRSIPDQLGEIFGGGKFHFDLLVVTHAHDDHIGCLPDLVDAGIVSADWALVTDELWGFGRDKLRDDDDAADFGLDDADADVRGLVAALCEEDHSELPADALQAFIDAAATVESRYVAMLKRLERDGTHVIRHARDALPQAFKARFAPAGLEVLGPSAKQLELCNAALSSQVKKVTRAVRRRRTEDAGRGGAALYREIIDRQSNADDADLAGSAGPPRNNQSIVLGLGAKGKRVLLGGDMQLAKPEVKGMDAEMKKLRAAVRAAGPYAFVKTLHHTSYNGQNDEIIGEWGTPKLLAHSGGRQDSGHPDKGTLQLLKERADGLDFARTDRNGMVVVTPGQGFKIQRGKLDDFSANRAQDEETPTARIAATVAGTTGSAQRGVQIIVARLPFAPARITIDGTEIELQQLGEGLAAGAAATPDPQRRAERLAMPSASARLAGGRNLRPLLFVTSPGPLTRNIGRSEAERAMQMVEAAGQQLLRLNTGDDPFAKVRRALQADAKLEGVVLLGGYDVVRSERLDVLPAGMRAQLGPDSAVDADDYVIWSDDAYGDRDASGFPDVPVSRIPDGRDAQLLLGALSAAPGNATGKFGIRNVARPFADRVWASLPGKDKINTSGPYAANKVQSADLNRARLYFMLHGAADDGRSFVGEVGSGGGAHDAAGETDVAYVTAIRADQIPSRLQGVALAGCCWGALTVDEIASQAGAGVPTPRVPEASIALTLLKSGLVAFVGCTGSHYSPTNGDGYFGGPMQQAFWANLCDKGLSPAKALLDAKTSFLTALPHGLKDIQEQSIEHKILREFTCLGLGW